MKQKTVVSIFLCFCLMFSFCAVSAAADSESNIETESESGTYTFNINDGDIFIMKSPASDYRSAGDALKVICANGEEVDFIPSEAQIWIIGNGTPTANRIIIDGDGLSDQTIVYLIFKNTTWDGTQIKKRIGSDIIFAQNNPKVQVTCLENNTLLINPNLKITFDDGMVVYFDNSNFKAGSSFVIDEKGVRIGNFSAAENTIRFANLEVNEYGIISFDSLKWEENAVKIGMFQLDEKGIRLNMKSDFLKDILPTINYLVTVFVYFF
ncbi:hypothetical protein LJC08_05145 [Methanimicrococcus sp. OttesenSCG-928-J09]|nr:hypothetical protein [Methanimicrococcus sp. OttesenSCG-928-J09]